MGESNSRFPSMNKSRANAWVTGSSVWAGRLSSAAQPEMTTASSRSSSDLTSSPGFGRNVFVRNKDTGACTLLWRNRPRAHSRLPRQRMPLQVVQIVLVHAGEVDRASPEADKLRAGWQLKLVDPLRGLVEDIVERRRA